ncbi:RecX family transcriptional regulator [Paenibacillus turpanensis]|uniref:RecX family transcriptional regulator n=1 Tax=Paenibacillus turpanensis TaxID=2689078 RepID=UPI00140D54F8|nr:RecX family transcriptional regulator [Paenibacillus turpanensis]
MKDEPIRRISAVEQQPKNRSRYNIFVEGSYAFSVHEDVLVRFRLFKNEPIDEEGIQTILDAEEKQTAYATALRFLGRKPRSAKEVRDKLASKQFTSEVIDHTMDRLVADKYVNDEQFSELWTENRIYYQKKGRRLIQQELLQKGVAKTLVQHTLEEINPEDEFRVALEAGAKKWARTYQTKLERKHKTASFLMRRGFTGALVQRVLRELEQRSDVDAEPENGWEEED